MYNKFTMDAFQDYNSIAFIFITEKYNDHELDSLLTKKLGCFS